MQQTKTNPQYHQLATCLQIQNLQKSLHVLSGSKHVSQMHVCLN